MISRHLPKRTRTCCFIGRYQDEQVDWAQQLLSTECAWAPCRGSRPVARKGPVTDRCVLAGSTAERLVVAPSGVSSWRQPAASSRGAPALGGTISSSRSRGIRAWRLGPRAFPASDCPLDCEPIG